MHITPFNQPFQDFVRTISCKKNNDICATNAHEQEHILDYLMQLMQYCLRFDQNDLPKGLHLHPEFFALPYVEEFFTTLFANLQEAYSSKQRPPFCAGFLSSLNTSACLRVEKLCFD